MEEPSYPLKAAQEKTAAAETISFLKTRAI